MLFCKCEVFVIPKISLKEKYKQDQFLKIITKGKKHKQQEFKIL